MLLNFVFLIPDVREYSAQLSLNRIAALWPTQVRELTGDITLSKAEVDETQIIITTPEKWDVITRKAGDRSYTDLARLLIIDEVHLLHDTRGPVLESIISRTIRQVKTSRDTSGTSRNLFD
jgi:pre-mRNA-splicing helicase BRR2